jgi:hypothetical protein
VECNCSLAVGASNPNQHHQHSQCTAAFPKPTCGPVTHCVGVTSTRARSAASIVARSIASSGSLRAKPSRVASLLAPAHGVLRCREGRQAGAAITAVIWNARATDCSPLASHNVAGGRWETVVALAIAGSAVGGTGVHAVYLTAVLLLPSNGVLCSSAQRQGRWCNNVLCQGKLYVLACGCDYTVKFYPRQLQVGIC